MTNEEFCRDLFGKELMDWLSFHGATTFVMDHERIGFRAEDGGWGAWCIMTWDAKGKEPPRWRLSWRDAPGRVQAAAVRDLRTLLDMIDGGLTREAFRAASRAYHRRKKAAAADGRAPA